MCTLRDLGRGPFAATFLLLLGASPALATDDRYEAASCEPNAPASPVPADPDRLDPRLRGVGLEDLGTHDATMVAYALRLKGRVPVNEVLATAIVSLHERQMVVDVVGRAHRFDDTDKQKHKAGRVGVVRVSVPLATSEGLCDVGQAEVLDEWSLTDLDLRYRVSISEWGAVLEDDKVGFRRVWPLGGGGIDRGVRYVGLISSMTPVIDDGLLDKKFAWRALGSPWYFRNKPYLPISIARSFPRKDGSMWKTYLEGKVAFHIWQDKGFERGFFSHGCMRMRSDDLAELAAYVFGQRAPIPVTIKVGALSDARHPYPLDTTKYWQLKNFGTPEEPKIRLKYMLHEMELGTEPLPDVSTLTPMTWDSKPILPPGVPVPKATKVFDPWAR